MEGVQPIDNLYGAEILKENNQKVALVTGAARGIGQAIALQLAADGFNVAINDIPAMASALADVTEYIKKTYKVKAISILADVSDPAENKAMFEETVKELGRLDVACANAGIAICNTVLDTRVEDWDRIFAINARGVFLTYQNAGKIMIAQGQGGRIIGTSSTGSIKASPILAAYCSSKFAVRGLTIAYAQEVAAHGITVNAVCPGIVDTKMWNVMEEYLVGLGKSAPGQTVIENAKRAAITVPEKPSDVARLVSFLASKGSAYVTGTSSMVDGGLNYM